MSDGIDVEVQARQLGWVPKEEFKGPEERWVDAGEFVRRGEEIMPILRQNNRELTRKLAETAQLADSLKKKVEENTEAMADFRKYHEESLVTALENQRKELTQQLKLAREDGDVEAEIKIGDQLDEVRQQQKDLKAKKEQPSKSADDDDDKFAASPELHPDFQGWQEDNEWFGKDKVRTRYAMVAAQEILDSPETKGLKGRAFFDKVTEMTFEAFPAEGGAKRTSNKVEGNTSTGGSRGTGKGYADMPAEARAACDKFARTLVGPGKAYKDIAEWRAKYASDFFST